MGERRQPPQASPRPRLCQGPPEGLLPVPCIPPSRPRPAAARGGPASASRPAREPQRARPPPSPQAGGRAGPGRPRPPGPAARGSAGRHRPLAAAERTAGGERGKAQLGPAARGDQGPGRHGEGLALQPPPSLLLPRPEPPGPAEPARPPSAGLAWGSAEPEPGPCGAVWGRPLAPRLRQDGLRGPASATLPSHSPGPARLRCCSGSAECALGSHKAACSGRELLLLQGWHACLGGGGRGGRKVCIFFSCNALNRSPAALEKAWIKGDGAPSLSFTNLFYQDGNPQSSSLMASCPALRVAHLRSPVAWATVELAAGFANDQTLPPGSTEHLVLISPPENL